MSTLNSAIEEYKRQVQKGDIVTAYRGLMEYASSLKAYLADKHPDYTVPGGLYFGYMDMTYFSFTPPQLKELGLKIAVVLLHDHMRWEAWLCGANKQVQAKFVKLFGEKGWNQSPISAGGKGVDSIVERILVESPDFDNPTALNAAIEQRTQAFVDDIQRFIQQAL